VAGAAILTIMNKHAMGVTVVLGCAGLAVAGGCSHQSVDPASAAFCGDEGCSGPGSAGFADGGGPTIAVPSGPRPVFQSTTIAATPPPPISGGTLIVTRDGTTAVAADPDRDAVYIVDLGSNMLRATVALQAGDEPGRLAEDGAGRVHVALRGSGTLASIDLASGTLLSRRQGCPAPRGVAWDSTTDSVYLACATGELVTLPAAGGAATRSVHVERDLRDVLVTNGVVSVTSFRAAEVLRIDPTGVVSRRDSMPSPDSSFNAHVCWRAIAEPSGTIVAVHQAQSTTPIDTTVPGGYGGSGGGGSISIPPISFDDAGNASFAFEGDAGAADASSSLPLPLAPISSFFGSGSAVLSVLTIVAPDGTLLFTQRVSGVLPVDLALSRDNGTAAVVTPGSSFTPGLSDLAIVSLSSHGETDYAVALDSQAVATAFDAQGDVLVQTRNPSNLQVISPGAMKTTVVALSSLSRDDTGHDVFHTQAGAQIACASCHPEGGDDGHVWILDGQERRTPSLRGTIAGTAPYHWPGDEKDLPTLVDEVYTLRMSGSRLPDDEMSALTGWIQTVPRPAAPSWVDPSAVSKGQALFEASSTACATCHSGAKYTNNQTVDVGTGGAFQVPPLVGVGWRTPLMHDGCAATIADRFGACATAQHGNTTGLSSDDIANLTAYLETL
jgi:cytochrome c peroxidase